MAKGRPSKNIAPSGANEKSAPAAPKKSSKAFIYLAIAAAIVVIAALAIYFLAFAKGSQLPANSPYSVLVSNHSALALENVMLQGLHSRTTLNASYNGTLSLGFFIFNFGLPVTLNMQKYDNDSYYQASVSLAQISRILGSLSNSSIGLPAMQGSMSISVYHINGTSYLCADLGSLSKSLPTGIKSIIPANGCISTSVALPQMQSSGNVSSLNLKTLRGLLATTVSNYSITPSTYSGNQCSLVSENLSLGVNQSYAGRLGPLAAFTSEISGLKTRLSTCLSDTYVGIPYTLSLSIPKITIPLGSLSNGTLHTGLASLPISMGLSLKARYVNSDASPQAITTLPYPVINVTSSVNSIISQAPNATVNSINST